MRANVFIHSLFSKSFWLQNYNHICVESYTKLFWLKKKFISLLERWLVCNLWNCFSNTEMKCKGSLTSYRTFDMYLGDHKKKSFFKFVHLSVSKYIPYEGVTVLCRSKFTLWYGLSLGVNCFMSYTCKIKCYLFDELIWISMNFEKSCPIRGTSSS